MFYKVLVVDDEPFLRNAVKALLPWEEHGFTICGEAANGEAALKLAKEQLPDVIFTDIVMPGTDGLDLLRNIKLSFPKTKVIMLTSYDEFSYVQKALQLGAADYILKPALDGTQMLTLLRHLFPGKPSPARPKDARLLDLNAMFDGVTPPSNDFHPGHLTLAAILTSHMNAHAQIDAIGSFAALLDRQHVKTDRVTQPYGELFFIHSDTWAAPAQKFFADSCLTGVIICHIATTSQLFQLCSHFQHLQAFSFFMPCCQVLSMDIHDLLPFQNPASFKPASNAISALADFMLFLQNVSFKDCITPQHLKLKAETTLYNYFAKTSHLEQEIPLFEQVTFSDNIHALRKAYGAIYDKIMAQQEGKSQGNAIMGDIIRYVEKNYNRNLTLYDVAASLHFNYSYLSHYFNTQSTRNFKEYLNNIRIEKAKDLLSKSDASISDICFEIGFGDHAYFSKVFRRITGLSPTEYKSSERNGKPS